MKIPLGKNQKQLNITTKLKTESFYKFQTFAEWSRYFFFLGALNLWAAGFFAFYGSGELQPWAVSNNCKTEKELDRAISKN